MKKPNIVVFMTDQQNAMTIGGRTPAKTPNIDEFLKDSVQFSDAYTVAPHCCPSRASLFSGLTLRNMGFGIMSKSIMLFLLGCMME